MKKILVVTDFSTSSRAALRFAAQLATTNHFQLIFFHVNSELKEASWKDSVDASFQDVAEEEMRGQLERFVRDTFGNNPNLERMFVISSGLSAVREIIKYAETNGVHYICASRSGLGRTTSLFGSTIESLIRNRHSCTWHAKTVLLTGGCVCDYQILTCLSHNFEGIIFMFSCARRSQNFSPVYPPARKSAVTFPPSVVTTRAN